MKVTHKVQLTKSEFIEAIYDSFSEQYIIAAIYNQYPKLPENFEFEIVDNLQEKVVKESTKESTLDNDGWIDVPEDWGKWYCPTINKSIKIEVIYRDGVADTGRVEDWTACWVQDGSGADIVKYRVK